MRNSFGSRFGFRYGFGVPELVAKGVKAKADKIAKDTALLKSLPEYKKMMGHTHGLLYQSYSTGKTGPAPGHKRLAGALNRPHHPLVSLTGDEATRWRPHGDKYWPGSWGHGTTYFGVGGRGTRRGHPSRRWVGRSRRRTKKVKVKTKAKVAKAKGLTALEKKVIAMDKARGKAVKEMKVAEAKVIKAGVDEVKGLKALEKKVMKAEVAEAKGKDKGGGGIRFPRSFKKLQSHTHDYWYPASKKSGRRGEWSFTKPEYDQKVADWRDFASVAVPAGAFGSRRSRYGFGKGEENPIFDTPAYKALLNHEHPIFDIKTGKQMVHTKHDTEYNTQERAPQGVGPLKTSKPIMGYGRRRF